MKLELHDFQNLEMNIQYEVSLLVSSYTNGQLGEIPQMISVSPGMVLTRHMGFVAMVNDVFAGYVGSKEPDIHNGYIMPEVGSLWVPKEYRKHGIAHKLVSVITDVIISNGELPYAFCNPLSKVIFRESGYNNANDQDIPAVAFGTRVNCKSGPIGNRCCDKLMLYKGDEL